MGATETKMLSYEEAKNRLGILFYTLESNFKRFVNNRENGVILQNEFCDLVYESIPSMIPALAKRFYLVFSYIKGGVLEFKEFCIGYTLLCLSTFDELVNLSFEFYSVKHNQAIEYLFLENLFPHLIDQSSYSPSQNWLWCEIEERLFGIKDGIVNSAERISVDSIKYKAFCIENPDNPLLNWIRNTGRLLLNNLYLPNLKYDSLGYNYLKSESCNTYNTSNTLNTSNTSNTGNTNTNTTVERICSIYKFPNGTINLLTYLYGTNELSYELFNNFVKKLLLENDLKRRLDYIYDLCCDKSDMNLYKTQFVQLLKLLFTESTSYKYPIRYPIIDFYKKYSDVNFDRNVELIFEEYKIKTINFIPREIFIEWCLLYPVLFCIFDHLNNLFLTFHLTKLLTKNRRNNNNSNNNNSSYDRGEDEREKIEGNEGYILSEDWIRTVIEKQIIIPINNNTLIENEINIKSDSRYVIKNESDWKILYEICGGGPVLKRKYIKLPNDSVELEIHPFFIVTTLVNEEGYCTSQNNEHFMISKTERFEDVKKLLCNFYLLDVNRTRLWYLPEPPLSSSASASNSYCYDNNNDDDENVINNRILINDENTYRKYMKHYYFQKIAIESMISSNHWIWRRRINTNFNNSNTSNSYSSTSLSTSTTTTISNKKQTVCCNGIIGLNNLGNTCYMNAPLQCLFHIPQLKEYFIKQYYLFDMNYDNKYDRNCQLVKSFSQLLSSLYKTKVTKRIITSRDKSVTEITLNDNDHNNNNSNNKEVTINSNDTDESISPLSFKNAIDILYPKYKGVEQHDAQEFFSDIIQGLSDDLNFNHSKPYIENEDSNGRDDNTMGKIWWINHLKRDCSIIEALFTGQFKSEVRCGVCNKISTHFEAFQMMQLPIPEKNFRRIKIKLYPQENIGPILLNIEIDKDLRVFELCRKVCNMYPELHLSQDKLILVKSNRLVVETIKPFEYLKEITQFSSLSLYQLITYPSNYTFERKEYNFEEGDEVYYLLQDRHEWVKSVIVKKYSRLEYFDIKILNNNNGNNNNNFEEEIEGVNVKLLLPESVFEFKENDLVYYLVNRKPYPGIITSITRDDESDDKFEIKEMNIHCYNNYDYCCFNLHKIQPRFKTYYLLYIIHRKPNFFLKSNGRSVVGYPIVMKIIPEEITKNKFYRLVYNEVKYLIKDSKPEERKDRKESNNDEIDDDDNNNVMEYPFTLKLVNRNGKYCSRCYWSKGCSGCSIDNTTEKLYCVTNENTIAIDWNEDVELNFNKINMEYGNDNNCNNNCNNNNNQTNNCNCCIEECGNSNNNNSDLNIYDCLNEFTNETQLDKESEAHCSNCKMMRRLIHHITLWRLPPFLIINLKRFKFSHQIYSKLYRFVDFPITNFDLSDYISDSKKREVDLTYWKMLGGKMNEEYTNQTQSSQSESDIDDNQFPISLKRDNKTKYNLFSVINHQGSISGGHYLSYIKCIENGKWYCYNDHLCNELDVSDVKSNNAYILIYMREDIETKPISELYRVDYESKAANKSEGECCIM